jgi:hypothetical protein
VNDAEYRATQAINYSALKLGRTSLPRMHACITGTLDQTESEAMGLGTMLHQAMAIGDGWADRYAIRPEGIDRRTKEGKDRWAAWLASLPPGAEILETPSQVEAVTTADRMRSAIMRHPLGHVLATSNGESEVAIVHDGRKARLDKVVRMNDDAPVMLVDWKTTVDASPGAFARSAAKYSYHLQAAWYIAMAQRTYGKRLPFVFVAVENTAPYSVGVYEIAPDQIEAATGINEGICKRYAAWLEAGAESHHTGANVEQLVLPEWACKDYTVASEDVAAITEVPF